MRLDDLPESSNYQDRRGSRRAIGGGIGLGGLLIVGLLSWATGIDPRILLGGLEMVQGSGQQQQTGAPPQQDDIGRFVSRVLSSTEIVWSDIFKSEGGTYQPPILVRYSGSYPTACGQGVAAMGPFYCPNDRKVYLDTEFFDELAQRFQAPGQFAQAYVVAHEVGHHVQNLLGILPKVNEVRQRVSRAQSNALSVRVELQADCFAGVWGAHARERIDLNSADIEAALNAATAIGDDTLQKETQGRVVPDSFTHGSSAQRVRWFKTGLQSGDIKACDTFSAENL